MAIDNVSYFLNRINILQSYTDTSVLSEQSNTQVHKQFSYFNSQPNTVINISTQARDKLAHEQKDVVQTLSESLQVDDVEHLHNELTKKDPLDEIIEDIQKQIKETQRQVNALMNIKTEKAEAERKALQAKLISLNSMLLQLMSKKLEATKTS
ncbi:hypothetical protein HII17_14240 [Thalassotalea sp. M1531]|uniref:Uncharacterized protein n=1 Tax=Thalassotalea algicola TaxID=2716224 RepID=A0A7Y0Q7T3_9GAMM|nr:hypothetical protein [Thalassotalea algicola]NMP32718.1 hypothetical protein [Thalassotalea algicola]